MRRFRNIQFSIHMIQHFLSVVRCSQRSTISSPTRSCHSPFFSSSNISPPSNDDDRNKSETNVLKGSNSPRCNLAGTRDFFGIKLQIRYKTNFSSSGVLKSLFRFGILNSEQSTSRTRPTENLVCNEYRTGASELFRGKTTITGIVGAPFGTKN